MTEPRDIAHPHDDGWVNQGKIPLDQPWDDLPVGESMDRGLRDSAAGRVRDGGDFTQYVDQPLDADGLVDDPVDDVKLTIPQANPQRPRRR
jgi:hypothetical protein